MQLIGLTGGIATGKSTVAKLFLDKGIPVIDVDRIARPIVEGQIDYIKQHCPEAVVNASIDRRVLAQKLFDSKTFRHGLNERVHPRIVLKIILLLIYHYLTFTLQVVIDVPLLFESGFDTWMSTTVVVMCSESEEVRRLVKRDSVGEEEAKRRINVQMPIAKKCQLADFVIDNNGDKSELTPQLERLLSKTKPSIILNLVYWSPIPVIILLLIALLISNINK